MVSDTTRSIRRSPSTSPAVACHAPEERAVERQLRRRRAGHHDVGALALHGRAREIRLAEEDEQAALAIDVARRLAARFADAAQREIVVAVAVEVAERGRHAAQAEI